MQPAVDLLLIEDDASDRELVQELVAAKGLGHVHVTEAASLRIGLELLAKRAFHVVLLDTHLPEASALSALRAVGEQAPHTPILAHSTFITVQTRHAARQRGPWDVVLRGELDGMWTAIEQLLPAGERPADRARVRAG
jgi:DNA-binding NtrC family response regulator